MSKIQHAVQKIKASSPSPRAAPVKKRAASEPREWAYGGRRIEVDAAELRAAGLLAPIANEVRLGEQFRAIKRPLLSNADPALGDVVPLGNLVMVASALSGEGKTFTCLNLCMSIARERDWSLVLVDGDASKPHLTRVFSAEREAGFLDLLRDPQLAFDDLVMPTDIPGLSLLPAGTPGGDASELLASRTMKALCDELSSADSGRMVVFDSSPLLLTTESIVLSSQVGQVLMVVRADSTPQQAVLDALEKLDPRVAINCVLNQSSSSNLSDSYGYYGWYGELPTDTER